MNTERLETSQSQGDLRTELSRKRTEINSSATFLTFEPGLYAIEFRSASGSMSDVGLPLPCARLEAVNGPGNAGRAFVSMIPEGGWLSRTTAAAHVLVVGGKAGAMLTLYCPTDGTPMPQVQFRAVMPGAAPARAAPAPSPVLPDAVAAAGAAAMLLVHVEGVGDRLEPSNEWVGDTSGQRALEGFALSLPAGMDPADLEYQGIMGEDWRTPWFEAGAFCGSRGLQLPLLGFRLRLVGEAAARFDCQAYGQFARAGVVGPVASGEDCDADNLPLTAMKVEITPKVVQPAAPKTAPETAPETAPVTTPETGPSPAEAVRKPRWRRPKL